MRYAAILLACALGTGSAAADTSRPFTHTDPMLRVRPTSAPDLPAARSPQW